MCRATWKGCECELGLGHHGGQGEQNALQVLENMIPTLGEICQGSIDWGCGKKGDMLNMLKQASSKPGAAIPIFHPDLFPIGNHNRKHRHTWFSAA